MTDRVRLFRAGALALAGVALSGCLAKEVEDPCNASPTFERYAGEAEAAARLAYEPEVPVPCPELDRPLDGNKAAEGVVFEEYAAVTSGSAGNFVDRDAWWVKALPRGELHVQTLEVYDQCTKVDYDRFSFHYSAATPAVDPVPDCGRSLSALQLGHQFFQSSPQLLQIEATAYARLVGLQLNPSFGTSLRFTTENAAHDGELFPALTKIAVTTPQPQGLSFVARLRGSTFEGVMQAQLVPAAATSLRVKLRLYPRIGADPNVRLGVLGMSSMFWKGAADTPDIGNDEAHDTDHLYVRMKDGTETRVALENPAPETLPAADPWARSDYSGALETIALEQLERDPNRYLAYESAHYGTRPSMSASEIEASVPLSAELSIAPAESEYLDNLVLDLIAETNGTMTPIDVSYVLTASSF
ncbi:MAG TPA: glucan biosynthesis protein [Polyangiaceae bacterium]|nr:glucan biosynthesis protein [Polyangiaceae bacterium]